MFDVLCIIHSGMFLLNYTLLVTSEYFKLLSPFYRLVCPFSSDINKASSSKTQSTNRYSVIFLLLCVNLRDFVKISVFRQVLKYSYQPV